MKNVININQRGGTFARHVMHQHGSISHQNINEKIIFSKYILSKWRRRPSAGGAVIVTIIKIQWRRKAASIVSGVSVVSASVENNRSLRCYNQKRNESGGISRNERGDETYQRNGMKENWHRKQEIIERKPKSRKAAAWRNIWRKWRKIKSENHQQRKSNRKYRQHQASNANGIMAQPAGRISRVKRIKRGGKPHRA